MTSHEGPSAWAGGLSMSVVYHNNAHYLARVVPPLLEVVRATGATCFLIDNASTDATSTMLASFLGPEDTRVHLLRTPTNLGFGRAHNLVLDQLETSYHLICNPDILFTGPDALTKTLAFLEGHPEVGLATIRLKDPDGGLQYANKRDPNVLDLFLRRFFRRDAAPGWIRRRMDRYEMRDAGYEAIVDVPFVNGAFMLVRTQLLKAVGGFDPRYFLYFEDADLSRLIRRTRHRTIYYPGASVIHFWERAAHKRLFFTKVLLESMIQFFRKWGWAWY